MIRENIPNVCNYCEIYCQQNLKFRKTTLILLKKENMSRKKERVLLFKAENQNKKGL
jgi:hypothetical protein